MWPRGVSGSVLDRQLFDVDSDSDPDPTFHFDVDPDPDPNPNPIFAHVGKYIFL